MAPVLSSLTDFDRRDIEDKLMGSVGCSPQAARTIIAEVLEPVIVAQVAHAVRPLRRDLTAAADALEKWNGVGDNEHSLVVASVARNLRKAAS